LVILAHHYGDGPRRGFTATISLGRRLDAVNHSVDDELPDDLSDPIDQLAINDRFLTFDNELD
jgi:hypothetical protein